MGTVKLDLEEGVVALLHQLNQPIQRAGKIEGFKIKDKDIMISEVINALEGIDLPEQVQAFIPGLDQEDLDAALRLATMILVSLENRV